MPRFFLTRLTIEGFRGINNEDNPLDIRFEPDSVNSIFAVNAIGKSSVFEALHYAIYGRIPKLESLGKQERPRDYYCNLFHTGRKASIQMEFQPDDQSATVSISVGLDDQANRTVTSPTGHSDPEGFLSTLQEEFALLDYRTFARFIEDSPLERGRTFSALLGFSEYSDCRQSLKAASDPRTQKSDLQMDDLKSRIDSVRHVQDQALKELRECYTKVTGNIIETLSCPDKYRSEVTTALGKAEILKPHLVGSKLEDVDFEQLRATIHDAEGGEDRQDLARTIEGLIALNALSIHEPEAISSEQLELQALVKERDHALSKTRGDLFKRLYETANEVVSSEDWEDDLRCPLCENTLTSPIAEHIHQQVNQYSDVAARGLQISKTWVSSNWKNYLVALESTKPLNIKQEERVSSSIGPKLESGEVSEEDLADAVLWTESMTEKVEEICKTWQARKESIEKKLPRSLVELTERVEHASAFKSSLERFLDNDRERLRLNARLDARERWKNFLNKAESAFSEAEAELTRARIEDLDSQYKDMFRQIMNDGEVVPSLKRQGIKEDLHINLSDFHGRQSLSARALLSESYRNALAISIFLAAAQKHSGAPRFVVLDDVTSSFDAGHQYQLMDLIRLRLQQPNCPDGLQFIILSHDGLLKKYFDRLDSETNWRHHTLEGLPPTGEVLLQKEGAERLKSKITGFLSTGQISQAEPLIRQYLEFKLVQIIRKVNIPVPLNLAIQDSKRMVGNCMEAITKAIQVHQQANTLVLDSQQAHDIESTHVPAIMGNWVAHYETASGTSLSSRVLLGVIDSIDQFAECFRYDYTSGTSKSRRWYTALDKR